VLDGAQVGARLVLDAVETHIRSDVDRDAVREEWVRQMATLYKISMPTPK
jgi:hypothetical protein